MKQAVLFFIVASASIPGKSQNVQGKDTFKKEISTYGDGSHSLFYEISKDRTQQLNLESIENGYDSIQIRLWYNYSPRVERKLLMLWVQHSKWVGMLYTFKVNWDGKKETIESVKKKVVMPKNGWTYYIANLEKLKILTLPNMHDIPNLTDEWLDGVSYNVEISTKNGYRFYEYHLPDEFKNFWQARNMVSILELNKSELGISWKFE